MASAVIVEIRSARLAAMSVVGFAPSRSVDGAAVDEGVAFFSETGDW